MTLTPLRAIRAKCLDCCCDSSNEVKLCPVTDCSLYPFRFGKNPHRAGVGNRHSVAPNTNSASDLDVNSLSAENYTPEYESVGNTHFSRKEKPLTHADQSKVRSL